VQILFAQWIFLSGERKEKLSFYSGLLQGRGATLRLSNPNPMLKKLFSFLIFLTLAAPIASAATTVSSASTTCPSTSAATTVSTATASLKVSLSALYPNPNTGEEEWIEVTNTGSTSVDLSLYTLEDATAKPWTLSGTLEAGKSTRLSGFPFQLNNSNEIVTLKTGTGTQLDTWTYATSTKGLAMTRTSESTATTATTADPAIVPTPILTTPTRWPSFSEAMPNPSGSDSTEEWIELYNTTSETLTLDGLQLDDSDGGSTPLALTGTLAGESYLVISIEDSKLTLNNTEDHVRLLGVNGEILWDISYTSTKEDQTYALIDGQTLWTEIPTPGEENQASTTTTETTAASTDSTSSTDTSTYQNGDTSESVEITEVFPNPAGPDQEEEWVEITNNGSIPVNLGNWTIKDASSSKAYTFPDSTLIEAGQTLVLYRTDSKIALKNSGENLQLLDFNGEVMSDITYDASQEDKSYAEIEVDQTSSTQASSSGLGNSSTSTWQWVSPSPGAKNPIWKQIKGTVSDWDGQWLTLFDGLSNWTFQADNSDANRLLFQNGNSVLVEASMSNGIYQIMHSQLLASSASGATRTFPWEWLLSGLAATSWIGYELYKKRKKAWTLPPHALN